MSERALPTEVVDLIAQQRVHPAFFFYADFPDGERRVWTGVGDWTDEESNVWVGIGGVPTLKQIGDSMNGDTSPLQISLNGLDEDTVNAIVNQEYQNRLVYIKLGFFDPSVSPRVLYMIETPIWEGIMDQDDIEYGADSVKLTLTCDHILVDILRDRELHYNDGDQRYLYPGTVDTGFSRVEQIQGLTIPWGRKQK
jgi:hypothetical protein